MRAPAAVLSAAAERFAGLGHCKRTYFTGGPGRSPHAVCTLGAVHLEVCGTASPPRFESPKQDQVDILTCLLAERITGKEVDDAVEAHGIVTKWNDADERSHSDVLALLRGDA